VYKIEGIILKRKNVGEADRIITVFSKEHGKLRLIARGIRKITSKRAPHLEVFTRISAIIHGGGAMESITEVEPLKVFPYKSQDLKKVSLAYYICELVDNLLPEKQEHRDVFILLTQALDALEHLDTAGIYRESKVFTLELLSTLGFLPRNKTLNGSELQTFVESITERKLKSTHFARLLMDS